MVRTQGGDVVPTVRWTKPGSSNTAVPGLGLRLKNRIFGKLKGDALAEAYEIVRDNGGLDVSGEYGSIDIDDKEFEGSQTCRTRKNS